MRKLLNLFILEIRSTFFYRSFPINICFIRGTTADTFGNISIEHEALRLEQYEIAAATKNSGGIVIVQVDKIVEKGSLSPTSVVIPRVIVDYIVVGDKENSKQHYIDGIEEYMGTWSGEYRIPLEKIEKMELSAKKNLL